MQILSQRHVAVAFLLASWCIGFRNSPAHRLYITSFLRPRSTVVKSAAGRPSVNYGLGSGHLPTFKGSCLAVTGTNVPKTTAQGIIPVSVKYPASCVSTLRLCFEPDGAAG